MPRCAVKTCRDEINLMVPRNGEQFEQWKRTLGYRGLAKRQSFRICRRHFCETDFERDLRSELLGLPKLKRLKTEALPTVDLYESYSDSGPNSTADDSIFTDFMEVDLQVDNTKSSEKKLLNEIQTPASETVVEVENDEHSDPLDADIKPYLADADGDIENEDYVICQVKFEDEVEAPIEEPIFNCDECDYNTTWEASLTDHKQSKHSIVQRKCDQCCYSTTYEESLRRHKKIKHKGKHHLSTDTIEDKRKKKSLITNNKGESYRCHQCDFTGASTKSLKIHEISKHDREIFSCDQCDFIALYSMHLTEHKMNTHDKMKQSCDQCDYISLSSRDLKRHQNVEHLSEDIVIEVKSRRKRNVGKSKKDKYLCEECDFVADNRKSLKRHLKAKHEEKR